MDPNSSDIKKFDCIVIGAGSGLEIASFAESQGKKVAIVEEGPMGGTCLNRGCIPSKMLIHSGDVAEIIKNSQKFGIETDLKKIDFAAIVNRVSGEVDQEAASVEKAIRENPNMTLFKTRGKFIGQKIIQVGDPSTSSTGSLQAGSGQVEKISADKIFIVAGTRSMIPPIPGLDSVKYITSTEALRLSSQPEHLVIVGGGYIGCELAHFFGSLGTKVTILVRGEVLLSNEDEEIASWFTKRFVEKYNVMFNTEVDNVSMQGDKILVKLKEKEESLLADQLLIATGRMPNTDILDVKATGVEMDEKGYIKVNEYLETNVPGIWALGDIVGILPFKHTANHQAKSVINNVFLNNNEPVDYLAIGHAVFSSPQIGGVGKTEQDLKKENTPYKVGKAYLESTGMGQALQEEGFVKVLTDKNGEKILGCHIIGPQASTLIHEVIIAMKTTGLVSSITKSVYVHPSLSEIVQRAFLAIE